LPKNSHPIFELDSDSKADLEALLEYDHNYYLNLIGKEHDLVFKNSRKICKACFGKITDLTRINRFFSELYQEFEFDYFKLEPPYSSSVTEIKKSLVEFDYVKDPEAPLYTYDSKVPMEIGYFEKFAVKFVDKSTQASEVMLSLDV
jgi:hypothetical protein